MSSHPGCTIKEAVELAVFLKKHNIRPEQVQDFYPTPGTISTAMYYTGLDPYTMQEVYIPRDPKEKEMQRALLQYYKKENKQIVAKALIRAGRRDLIGYGKECLITPDGLALQQDRIRAAAGVKCRRKSTNVLIALAVIIACVCIFMTLNEYVFNIEHLPCWSRIFSGKNSVSAEIFHHHSLYLK